MEIEGLYDRYLHFRKVDTDSRKINRNSLFFALKGENFDGNRFAREALDKGAAFAIVDQLQGPPSPRIIVVDDVLKTLQDLAHLHRQELGIPIIAITGSNGKTTTKELITAVLATKFRVSATGGNLNNHIGVPLTLLQMDEDTEIGVIEMGANHPGEIGELCSIADPDYGLITNIGKAHLEGFGSFEGVKKTKAELYQYIRQKEGTLFLNRDNAILTSLIANYENLITYGKEMALLTGEVVAGAPFLKVNIHFPSGTLEVNTQLSGSYNFENVLAAASVGGYFGVEPMVIEQAVSSYAPRNNRSQLIHKGNLTIVMDAYNANPSSMQVSIDSFVSAFKSPRFIILGDMLELGRDAEKEHRLIFQKITKLSFKAVYFVGPLFSKVVRDFDQPVFLHTNDLLEYLQHTPIKEGSLLVKGSRKMQLEKILDLYLVD